MKHLPAKLHRPLRRDCARDPIADIDPLKIDVRIGERSDLPLEVWREQLKRRRREIGPHPDDSDKPATPGRRPPEGSIDEYAAPV